jgi:transposase InsO family protein
MGLQQAAEEGGQATRKTFIKSHWEVLAAIDFTSIEVWTKTGLVTYYLLFGMELSTRRVHLATCTRALGDDFMKQIARNLTDPFNGFLKDKRYLLIDRDSNFRSAFRTTLENAGVKSVRLPARSPNLNSQIEPFHLSIKSECLERMIFFGEKSLRRAVAAYLHRYHKERNHQGLANLIIKPGDEVGRDEGDIQCRERLGGLLRYYYRDAA